jgi:hypothetical protein
MLFAKELRERIRRGELTCSVRIWMRPKVKVGGRYQMESGRIEVYERKRALRRIVINVESGARR